MVEHLEEPATEQQEPEQEYAVAKVLAEHSPTGLLRGPLCLIHGVLFKPGYRIAFGNFQLLFCLVVLYQVSGPGFGVQGLVELLRL